MPLIVAGGEACLGIGEDTFRQSFTTPGTEVNSAYRRAPVVNDDSVAARGGVVNQVVWAVELVRVLITLVTDRLGHATATVIAHPAILPAHEKAPLATRTMARTKWLATLVE